MLNLGFFTAHILAGLLNSAGDTMTTQAKADAITVIGGADGPTAIFLASNGGNTATFIGSIIAIGLVAVGIVSLATYRSKKKNHKIK